MFNAEWAALQLTLRTFSQAARAELGVEANISGRLMDSALRRVEDMESYVTSRQYELNKEFSKL